jgi:hypothetical protein
MRTAFPASLTVCAYTADATLLAAEEEVVTARAAWQR